MQLSTCIRAASALLFCCMFLTYALLQAELLIQGNAFEQASALPRCILLCMQGLVCMMACRCHWGPCPPCAHFCGTPHPCGHACSRPSCHDAPAPPIPAFTSPPPPVSASFIATKPVQAEAHDMPSAAFQVSSATKIWV